MGLSVYILPPGSGGARPELLKGALPDGPDYSRVLYLTPTSIMLEQARAVIHGLAGRCYIAPSMHTPGRLALRLAPGPVLPACLAPVLLAAMDGAHAHGGLGLGQIRATLAGELGAAFPGHTPDELGRELDAHMDALALPEEVTQRVREALAAIQACEDRLEASGYTDETRAMALAARGASVLGPLDLLVLDGFYEMTQAEAGLTSALMGLARDTLIMVPVASAGDDLAHCFIRGLAGDGQTPPHKVMPATDAPGPLRYEAAPSIDREVALIARRIKASYVSGAHRGLQDICLAVPRAEDYAPVVERVFRRYGVPYTMGRARALAEIEGYADVMRLVRAVVRGYPRLDLASALTSPHLCGISAEARASIPSMAMDATGVGGRAHWERVFGARGLKEDAGLIFGALEPLRAMQTGTMGMFTGALATALDALGFEPPDEGKGEFEGALGALEGLDEITGGRAVGPGVFAEALGRLLDATTVDGGDSAPGVRMCSLYEARGLEPAVLYLGGMRDGDLPSPPDPDLLLPDPLRARLGLMDSARHMALQGRIVERLVGSARTLHVSYPSQEEDKYFLPSQFISHGECANEDVPGVYSPDEAMTLDPLPPGRHRTAQVRGVGHFLSGRALYVTDIDAYRRCPRRLFIERVMGHEPPRVLEFALEPRDLGTVLHTVMERLIPMRSTDQEAFTRDARRVLQDVMRDAPMDPYFRDLVTESFLGQAPSFFALEAEIRDWGYEFHGAEHRVRDGEIGGARFTGKMDRIDVMPGGGAIVLDYKSGSATINAKGIYERGEMLQLPIYALLLQREGLRPERVGIYSLRDASISWLPGKTEYGKGVPLGKYTEAALGYLKDTVAEMRSGDFPARPVNAQACRKCPETPYCPYIHKAQDG